MPDLSEDVARQQKVNARRLVPLSGVTGHVLTVTGQEPFRYAFRQPPDSEIPRYPGSPDGELSAPIDSLVRNTDDHSLWINTDGETAWSLVGGSGGTLITDSYYEFLDDGTTTGKLFTAGDVENKWDAVSGFNNGSDVSLASGVVTIDTTGIYSVAATWGPIADTAADGYTYARGRFTAARTNEPGSPVHDQVFLDDAKPALLWFATNKHAAMFSISFVGFMYAGDQLITETRFEANGANPGSTWSILTASMYVERLA